jgi:histone H3/H4
MHNLIRNQTGKRVSENAADELGEILERFAGDAAEEAIALASQDGYKTIKQEHIQQALK